MSQDIIFILVIAFFIAGVFFWMWKLSKWLVVPIQIVLFILLVTVVFKVFFTADNAVKLSEELEKSGVIEVENGVVSGAVAAFKKHVKKEVDSISQKKKDEALIPEQPSQGNTSSSPAAAESADEKNAGTAVSESECAAGENCATASAIEADNAAQ